MGHQMLEISQERRQLAREITQENSCRRQVAPIALVPFRRVQFQYPFPGVRKVPELEVVKWCNLCWRNRAYRVAPRPLQEELLSPVL